MAHSVSAAPGRTSLGRLASWAAWLASVAASGYFLVTPVYRSHRAVLTAGGTYGDTSVPSATLAAVNGPHIYLLLALPVLVTALPLLADGRPVARRIHWGSAALVTAFALFGLMSIGALYLPAAGLSVVAALLPRDPRPAT